MSSSTEQVLKTAIKQHLDGNTKAALGLYNRVLSAIPDNLVALVNQSAILMDLHNFSGALSLLERALIQSPNDVEALNNYGNSLTELGQLQKAIEQFESANEIAPKNSTISINLGRALLRRGDYEKAIKIFEAAIKYDPDNIGLRFINALALPIIPDSIEQLQESRNRQSVLINTLLKNNLQLSDPIKEVGITNFISAYHGYGDVEIQNKLATCYRNACPQLNYIAPHIGKKSQHKKIRVGFVSAHLGSHTIGKLNYGLISGLNRNKFKIFIFHLGTDKRKTDQIRDKFRNNVDEIFFLKPTLTAMRSSIEKIKLDILYYPDIGMDPVSYFLSFSRLARIQCVTWGHPVSTGVSTIDYFISSKIIDAKLNDSQYTEKLLRLDQFSTDYSRPILPNLTKSRSDFNLKDDANIYFCPQSLFKLHPDFDKILGEILRADPNGEIILLEGQHQEWGIKLRTRLNTTIPDVTARIKFIPRLNGSDFLECISLANVILDTPHFCGGNTSYEAFSLGKIIVTLPSRFLRGRLTMGLYHQMGIKRFIAKNPEEYVKLAVKFGVNREAQSIAERDIRHANKAIFDTQTATKAHEKIFLEVMKFNHH